MKMLLIKKSNANNFGVVLGTPISSLKHIQPSICVVHMYPK